MWIIAIPVIAIVLFMVYNYVIVPTIKKKEEAKNQSLMNDFSAEVNGQEREIRERFTRENSYIKPIADQIGEPIQALISCMEKREMKDFLRQQAVAMAGKAVKGLTGFGFKEVDNTEYYYLALTDRNLHYLHYSLQGKCKEHLVFDGSKITDPEVGEVTAGETVKNNAAQGDSTRFGFVYDDTLYKFFFYDNVWGHPAGKSKRNKDKEFAEINYLFAEPFKKYTDSLKK